jgi:hypothetical protein
MAADWHPAKRFDALILHLFTGAVYTSSTCFKMNDVKIVDIGLCIGKEYKAWIAREAIRPRIVKTIDTVKTFWATKIILVNQTTIPTSMHGYGMVAVNNGDSVVSYGELLANFGAAYAATQESVKSQGTRIASMQGQMQAMQQYCMALGQQPPNAIYMLQQQQRSHRSASHGSSTGGRRNLSLMLYQHPGGFPSSQHPLQPPPHSRHLKIGTTAIRMAGASTTPTPACPAVTQVRRTT